MPVISQPDLRKGDVLLYRSNSLIARWICSIDGSEVSHAGLYLGDGMVGEALIVENPGLNANPIAMSFAGSEGIIVRRLRNADLPIEPVIACARNYLEAGNRYAHGQLLLAACICLARNVSRENALQRWVMKTVMQKATDFLRYWQRQGREPMICSEFVFRAYDEADPRPDDDYSLRIISQSDAMPKRQPTRGRLRVFGRQFIASEQSTVHPSSLLRELQDQPPRLQLQATSFGESPTPPSDAELDDALAEFLGDRQSFRATSADGPIGVDDAELLLVASDFAAQLSECTPEVQAMSLGPAETPHVSKVIAALANFVTPGDLMKTPSLHDVGTIAVASK